MAHEWTTKYCEYANASGAPPGQVKVTILHWYCHDEDVDGNEGSSYGTIDTADQNRVYALPALEAVPNHVMTGWVKQALGPETVQRIEDAIDVQIEQKANPTTGGFIPAP